VSDLLKVMIAKVEHAEIVQIAKQEGVPELIRQYLLSVQAENNAAVNDALHELYIEEEDYQALALSIDAYDKFDNLSLAGRLEKHELLEFRRIAAVLYKKHGQWQQSVELSKRDNLYADAMKAAAESGDADVVENILRYFVEQGNKECFAACLYACYDLVRPDVVMELAWRNGLTDFAMPYLVQVIKEYTNVVDELRNKEKKKAEKEKEKGTSKGDAALSAPTSTGFPTSPVVVDPYMVQGIPMGMVPVGMPIGYSQVGVPMSHQGLPLQAPGSAPILNFPAPTSGQAVFPSAPLSGGFSFKQQ